MIWLFFILEKQIECLERKSERFAITVLSIKTRWTGIRPHIALQREYITKEDTVSPTVGIDAFFITRVIDAHENLDKAKCNLPGVFLHIVTDEKETMIINQELSNVMVRLDLNLY